METILDKQELFGIEVVGEVDVLRKGALEAGYDEDELLLEESVCGGNAGEYLHVGYGMKVKQF